MTKRKKKECWKNEWKSVQDITPPIGAIVITIDTDECPSLEEKGNINQYIDGDWYHISKKGKPKWWKFLTPEEFSYYQDLAIDVWLDRVKISCWIDNDGR